MKKRFAGATAAALRQDVQHDAFLIHGAPKIAQLALYSDEGLIEMPLLTRPRPPATKIVGEGGAKLQAPSADALVRDDDTALGQQQFDIPELRLNT